MPEESVLVVDDETGIIQLCRRLLERAGFHVSAVTDPQEGSLILDQQPVDLLLVDIRMPGMDGFQLIDLARQRQPDLAVVVMTGFGTVETAIEALRRGADSLVLKPFAGAELVQSVQRALKESQNKRDILRLQTLRPLFAITEALFTETNPERLQGLLLDTVCGHLHCSHAGLYQSRPGEQGFWPAASRGEPLLEEGECLDLNQEGQPETWMPLLGINRDGPGDESLQQLLARYDLASLICAPMAQRDGSFILVAGRKNGMPFFRELDLEILAILARQAGVALENARLHTELRTYIRQVEESQRALIQAEKMAVAGRLTASIAHEINNPLQSVRNCLHLAARKELSPEERQDYLDLARSELERLMSTVQRMLDYYRPGAVDRKAVDVNEMVQRVLSLLAAQLDDHNIQVQTRLSKRMQLVLAVGDQVQQVLLNLILNSMEAMPQGGRLSIETASRKKYVEVSIRDTGPGVPEEQRSHIFEPFISTKEGGTGLGLAVSYGIVAAHGGSLELVSSDEPGACFRITLPVGEAL